MSNIPKYKVIVIDPPWDYQDSSKGIDLSNPAVAEEMDKRLKRWGGQLSPRHHLIRPLASDYSNTMSINEIKKFRLINQLADPDNCTIFLWTTNRFLYESPEILYQWGFDLGCGGRTMVWNKLGQSSQIPGGWCSNVEFVVVGHKGMQSNKWRTTKGLKAGFSAKNEGHSVKPALFYRMIRECTHAPRVDIFARRRHEGFDAWGDQVEVRENDLVSNYPPQKVIKLGSGELHMDLH